MREANKAKLTEDIWHKPKNEMRVVMQSVTGTWLDVVKAINYLGVIFTYFKLHFPVAKLFLTFLPHSFTKLRKELHV